MINVFGFTGKRYGYAHGYKNRPMKPKEALEFAGLDQLTIPKEYAKRQARAVRFTVVRGVGPKKWSGRSTIETLVEGLRFHPQLRRLLRTRPVHFVRSGQPASQRLFAEELPPLEGFEGWTFDVPDTLTDPETSDQVDMTLDGKYEPGILALETSADPLHGARLRPLNSIDIRGDLGVLASYPLAEIASFDGSFISNSAQTEFLYGDCLCESLDDRDVDPDEVCVSNDRERLHSAPRSRALLSWIKLKVAECAAEIAGTQEEQRRDEQMRTTSQLNQFLNKWKDRFMDKIYAEIWVGPFSGFGAGGTGGGGAAGGGKGGGSGDGKDNEGPDEDRGGGSGDQKKKGPRHYEVLLSNYDPDPLSEDGSQVKLTERQPPIYQRPQDVVHGLYWINTQTALASAIIKKEGTESTRWRDYLFQRHVDIIISQAILDLPAHGTDLTADSITNVRDEVSTRIFQAAATDLESYLFG